VSPSRARVFSCALYFQAPATQASIEAAGDPVVRTLALVLVMVNSDATRGRARPGGSYSYFEGFSFTPPGSLRTNISENVSIRSLRILDVDVLRKKNINITLQ